MRRTPDFRISIVIGGVVVLILLMGIKSCAGEDWELITKIPTKRKYFSTTVVDGKIYLIGGNFYSVCDCRQCPARSTFSSNVDRRRPDKEEQ